ncbi:Cdc6-related protein, AAA superfamily ATPase [Nonomuraea solani]|uniref:Cdc6-related protein, AAA superfamily ATPase n=1 Tax=Nonomuraea solani TaxID=1144553 RepID=A0A1H6D3J6_9ACTN|nr:tetratricopeptide repeat protein [Nonomuraea solani]SEG79912.1 Cdc6-related protein, AAA superfamily ATPase [Nonomuraea solani]
MSEIVHNDVTGVVHGPLVQARDVFGGVHFHTAASLPAPSQLPPRPRLVDREAAIAQLDALRAEATDVPLTVLITGPVGVGKTALSLTWAHMIRSDFPDGQLYADLRGHSGAGPASPQEVLGDFLQSLGVPTELIPGELAQRAALYRTVTRDQRVLVLLDDAMTAAQVRPLLPSSSASVTVVTSRYRLTGLLMHGMRSVYVDRFDAEAGLSLLRAALGSDRLEQQHEAASELVELCMRLPLALSVAAARLAARPSWPLREMVAALAEEQRTLAALSIEGDVTIRSALDLSYRALRSNAAGLYRLLSLTPGDRFGGDATAALAGISRMEARRLLGELTDANLLTDTADGRYRFHHALVRLHASQLVEAEDQREARELAVGRLLSWYLATTSCAERRLRPHRTRLPRDAEPPPAEVTDFGGPEDALMWLESERANLSAAVTLAREHGRETTAWQLADAMWALFLFMGHHVERVEVEETGLAAARSCGDPYAEGKMLNRLGLSLNALGRHDEAVARFEGALEIWRRLGEREREVGSLRRLGLVAAARGDHGAAIARLTDASAAFQALGADRKTALTLIDLAGVLMAQDRGPDAVVHLERARQLLSGVDDSYNRARVGIFLGHAHASSGDGNKANQELRAALDVMAELGSSVGRAAALEGLGNLAERTGRRDEARRMYEAALQITGQTESIGHFRIKERLAAFDRHTGVCHET